MSASLEGIGGQRPLGSAGIELSWAAYWDALEVRLVGSLRAGSAPTIQRLARRAAQGRLAALFRILAVAT